VESPSPQIPLFRIMFGNATLLSVVYLAVGVLVELLRRFYPMGWVNRATLVLDSLPGRTLELLGLMEPLRLAYVYGRLGEGGLRVVFAVTTLLIIFAMALVVGAGMWLLRRYIYRRFAEG
jgi:hypothetical protein